MADSFSYDDASATSFSYEDAGGAAPKTGVLRKLADIGVSFAGGAVGATKAIADAGGAGNAVSRGLDGAQDGVESLLSPARQAEKAARAQTIADAEKSGSLLREVGAQLGGFVEAPVSTLAEAAGSVVPVVGAMLTPAGRGAAGRALLGVGLGAAQGAGAVKGSIYDAVKQEHVAQGAAAEVAQQAADQAQAYTGPNAGSIALGAGLGAVAGTSGVEGAVNRAIAGRAAAGGASIVRRAAVGAVTEGVPEAVQGGQERLASNLALQDEGFETPTWRGVAGQAAVEGLTGGVLGAGVNAASRGQARPGAMPGQAVDAGSAKPSASAAAGTGPDAGAAAVVPGAAIDPTAGPLSKAASKVGNPASMQLSPEEARAFNNAYRREVPAPLEELQQSVRTGTAYTTPADAQSVSQSIEDAWLQANVPLDARLDVSAGAVPREAAPMAETDARVSEAIAQTDAKVRDRRILSALQNLVDEPVSGTAAALHSLDASLSRVGEAILSGQERERVQRMMGAHAAFTGRTDAAPLPDFVEQAVDAGADNAAMEALIPERGPTAAGGPAPAARAAARVPRTWPQRDQVAEVPPTVARPSTWRSNAIAANKVARDLGLNPKGKRLALVVGEIDAADAARAGRPHTVSDMSAGPIAGEWSAFAAETGTLGIPRAQMPQIKAGHRGALVNFLKSRGITGRSQELPAADLKPTQAEFSQERAERARQRKGGDRSILISSDGYVVDGHHQWLAKRADGQPVNVIRLNAPIRQVLGQVAEFPSTTTDGGGQQTQAGLAAPGSGPALPNTTAARAEGSAPAQAPASSAGSSALSAADRMDQLEASAADAEARAADWTRREYWPNNTPLPQYEAAGGPVDVQEANEQRRLKAVMDARAAAASARAAAEALLQQGNIEAQLASQFLDDERAPGKTSGERRAQTVAKEGAARRALLRDAGERWAGMTAAQRQALAQGAAGLNGLAKKSAPARAWEDLSEKVRGHLADAMQPPPARGVAETGPSGYIDSYGRAQEPTQPDDGRGPATGPARSAAADGVRGAGGAVPRRTASLVGLGIADRIERVGSQALIGQRVDSAERLAELAQVYRDPRFETFRVFFLKGDEVVHATGVSSRMPGEAPMMPAGMTFEQYLAEFQGAMQRTGADGYYILHNHPSGNPTPSNADRSVTEELARQVPGMLAHVVINSGKYAVIEPANTRAPASSMVQVKEFGEDLLLKSSKPAAALGAKIAGPDDLASIGKSMQKPGWITLVGTGSNGLVRAISEAPASILTRSYPYLAGTVRRFMRQSGSASVFAVGEAGDIGSKPVRTALEAGILRDALPDAGQSLALQGVRSVGGGFRTPGRAVAEVDQAAEPGAASADSTAGASPAQPSQTGADTPRFNARGEAPETGLSLEQAQQAVQQALAGIRNPPPIDIVTRSEEAWVGAPEGVMGAAIPEEGRIVLVASAHGSADAVIETVFHEMFHLGVRNVLPTPDYVQSMLDLAKRDARVQQYAIEWKAKAPDAPHQLRVMRERGYTGSDLAARYEALAIEEGLAVVAEELRAQKQAGTRLGMRVRTWANWLAGVAERMGMQRLADRVRKMTYNQAERFVMAAIDQAGRAPRRQGGDAADGPRFRTRDGGPVAQRVGAAIKASTVTNLKQQAGFKATDYMPLGLQLLGRRQLVDVYGDLLPQLSAYSDLIARMDADKNEAGAGADVLATTWGKLPDERQLAELMHDATLAQIDPAKDFAAGDNRADWMRLRAQHQALSTAAQDVYTRASDTYSKHMSDVRAAIKERIERSDMGSQRKAEMIKRMDDEFFGSTKGVYFPLARFGQYVVVVKDANGKTVSVSRAETMAEADAARRQLQTPFPASKGFTVGKVLKAKEFVADRDAVGRGFMEQLYGVLDKQGMDSQQKAELEDALGQLYLSALPDLSWAKHGIHRKGTPGFSQDARRAFAQNVFHGASYLAKLRYSDQLQDQLADMEKHVGMRNSQAGYDSVRARQVLDEMQKRHESAMNPKSSSLSTSLTSLGFIYFLGLSPASAMVNLTQTALVAYPVMGARWGYGKASAALMKASQQAVRGKNDITAALSADEKAAFDEAVRSGVIDVTMAHDLAGVAQGEDMGVMWKLRPVMKWASFLFHHAEKFNRQITFVAAYRLARETGLAPIKAYADAVQATYDGHFDYSANNRPRVMQGNAARVLLLFKQYGQNMVYTLARSAQQSLKGDSPQERAEARKTLGGLLVMHGLAAGALGLPMVTTLLAAASMLGGDDDEPWDAQVALQNVLADTFGQKPAEVLAHGLSRLTPWDISGRVGLDRLIFPDIQEGLEGQRLGESAMAAALGPVAGIGINALKGLQDMGDGRYLRGLEGMMPTALRAPLKAWRYGIEGVLDKSGIVVQDEVDAAALLGQAAGFSPSSVRNSFEGKSAIVQHDRALQARRSALVEQFAMAAMAGDEEGKADVRADIAKFNEKNPGRRIQPLQLAQSVRMRTRRIEQAQEGVYLPTKRRDALEAGRFATGK